MTKQLQWYENLKLSWCLRSTAAGPSLLDHLYSHLLTPETNKPITYMYEGLFTLDPRRDFNAHQMRICCVHTWIWFWALRIGCTSSQSTFGGGMEPNSLFIHRIMIKSSTVTLPMNSNIVEALCLGHHTCCICHPIYEQQWPIILGCYWLDAVNKETIYQDIPYCLLPATR